MTPLMLVAALAAGAGAVVRYLVSSARHQDSFPWHTVWVNVAGTVVVTALVTLAAMGRVGADAVLVIGAGFAGGLTTVSTLAADAETLRRRHGTAVHVRYLAWTVGLSFSASLITWMAIAIVVK